ncbi:phosphopantetheine-binding protein [Streptomyces sp. VNUA24]|uniref:phosphopantetheine-binding protein n=1 Tax=Streptomyces sp. VNUA24 TaxID=3031131 RepID=UPI0023B7A2C3|nr:phosphopantetheine-binding protein [Streptomyces sp. VNUA24]WEH12237.1 phosphopantetheine-binding protein [Streptomyces sp. VNUA24]
MPLPLQAPWDDRFEKILRENLAELDPGRPLEPDASLPDLGMDSLKSVALLVALEDAYGITFPDEGLTARTFASPRNLWMQVAACMSAPGQEG